MCTRYGQKRLHAVDTEVRSVARLDGDGLDQAETSWAFDKRDDEEGMKSRSRTDALLDELRRPGTVRTPMSCDCMQNWWWKYPPGTQSSKPFTGMLSLSEALTRLGYMFYVVNPSEHMNAGDDVSVVWPHARLPNSTSQTSSSLAPQSMNHPNPRIKYHISKCIFRFRMW